MTAESNLIGSFCRLYAVLLYAYPAEFRRQFGRPMEQLFRDRCRDLARTPQRLALLRFAVHMLVDWFRTTVRESAAVATNCVVSIGKRFLYRNRILCFAQDTHRLIIWTGTRGGRAARSLMDHRQSRFFR